jgi:hypothetical protein
MEIGLFIGTSVEDVTQGKLMCIWCSFSPIQRYLGRDYGNLLSGWIVAHGGGSI